MTGWRWGPGRKQQNCCLAPVFRHPRGRVRAFQARRSVNASGVPGAFTASQYGPSRSHLVAIHFSPSSTGAPPCSVRVAGCGMG